MMPAIDHTSAKMKRFSIHSGSCFAMAAPFSSSSCRQTHSASRSIISALTFAISSVSVMPTVSIDLHSLRTKRRQGGTSQPKRLRNLSWCGVRQAGSVLTHEVSSGSQPMSDGST